MQTLSKSLSAFEAARKFSPNQMQQTYTSSDHVLLLEVPISEQFSLYLESLTTDSRFSRADSHIADIGSRTLGVAPLYDEPDT